MNKHIKSVFDQLHENNITYCHFKSNNNLEPAADGVDDLDILVSSHDISLFNVILLKNGFKFASDRNSIRSPYVYHYFSADPHSGLLIHFHVYYKLVTGGSILKNHWIQLENLFLNNRNKDLSTGIYIPFTEVDLILLIIRKYIEQTSVIEHYLFAKDLTNIKKEICWLYERIDLNKLKNIFTQNFPLIPYDLFENCIEELMNGNNPIKRISLALKFNRYFICNVYNPINASLLRTVIFTTTIIKSKIGYKRNNRWIYPGGLLLAFTGSEASGKSTISNLCYNWLSERFDTHYFHLGKPNKNWRTIPIWFLINIYSSLKKILKFKSNITHNTEDSSNNTPHPLVCFLDSVDRKFSILKIIKLKMQGAIIITDRYPSRNIGGLDGPRITKEHKLNFISKYEFSNYSMLVQPDIVFKMIAPLNVTLKRNNQRAKPEPEEFVRERYKLAMNISFIDSLTYEIDTTNKLEETLSSIKKKIWYFHSNSSL